MLIKHVRPCTERRHGEVGFYLPQVLRVADISDITSTRWVSHVCRLPILPDIEDNGTESTLSSTIIGEPLKERLWLRILIASDNIVRAM